MAKISTPLIATIVASTIFIALIDMCTSAELVGSILFAFPLALCALQGSKRVLWSTTLTVVVLTFAAGIWGFHRDGSSDLFTAMLNRTLLAGALLTMAFFIHLVLERDRVKTLAVAEAHRMEVRFRRLLESAPDAMVIADATGTIQLVNAQAERIFGYGKEEMLGQRVEMLIPSHLLARHEGHRTQFAKDPKFRMMGHGMELQGRRKDGTEFPVEIALSPLESDGDRLVSAAVRDITDRKRDQAAQQHLVAIMRSSNDAIISKDRQGIITSWNPGAERLFGYAASEVIGKHVTILFPADRREEEEAIERNVFLQGGRFQHYETVRQHKDGSLIDVSLTISPILNEKGEIIGASKFAQDIGERKRKEAEILELNRTLEERVAARSDELLKSEKRYHNALDSMMEGVQIIGYDWTHLYVNDALIAQSTFTREELLGHTMMERYPGVEQTDVFKAMAECMQDRTARTLVTDFTFPNGCRTVFDLSIQPMEEGLLILSTDITERRLSEEKLRASEVRFRAIIEGSEDGIAVTGSDRHAQYLSPASLKILGYAPGEMEGRRLIDLVAHEQRPGLEEVYKRVMAHEGASERTQFQLKHKDGSMRWVDALITNMLHIPAVSAVVTNYRDITEAMALQEQLALDRSKLRAVINSTDDRIYSLDRDYRLIAMNDAFMDRVEHLTGKRPMVGEELDWLDVSGRPAPSQFRVLYDRALHGERFKEEQVITTPSESIVEVSFSPILDGENVLGVTVFSRDITERKKAEKELEHQRERLELQNQELEQFAYIASHDLQEPLRMVTSFMQLLQRRYKDKLDQEGEQYIGFAVDGAKRMKQLINDLLLYSKLGRPVDISEVDMNVLFEQVTFDLALTIKENMAVLESEELPRLHASRTEMVQLLQNLISNAIKFRRMDIPPHVRVRCRGEGDHWHFEVADNGIGIAEQYKEKVFMPFKRLHDRSRYSGSGVGLAVAHKIVLRSGGRIWFDSKPGVGTIFHFTLKR